MKKNRLYSFLHIFLNIFPHPKSEALHFSLFFFAASAFEFLLSRLIVRLSGCGLYDFHTAARFAPAMAEAALISLFLSIVCGVIFDLVLRGEHSEV